MSGPLPDPAAIETIIDLAQVHFVRVQDVLEGIEDAIRDGNRAVVVGDLLIAQEGLAPMLTLIEAALLLAKGHLVVSETTLAAKIERVARAICVCDLVGATASLPSHQRPAEHPDSARSYVDQEWVKFVNHARAAIAAMEAP